ncbi:glutamyl-tRNA(Gln) amidotransferase subunit A, chloroplastic/mitochondrial-like [Magnolia sinica]|uniref:glutamyl-tRNA(Gln) amidotransferase subunit A, chloroplastic/mitochondrial-like n=1 Tax=Magnolia sinica TaxID=86752 RepID=UPI002658335B|nr:glutamyl-tRNA(Gln) amidotransferase subunit A, chloroplastic/mitochondrial-like [Magnolia sinica]
MRILMGTCALSAGYYDAYYKLAQQVRTLVQKSFKAALDENDILLSSAAPSAAYKIGDIMTVILCRSMLINALQFFSIPNKCIIILKINIFFKDCLKNK